MNRLHAWWSRNDQYDWFSHYLASRQLQRLFRWVMATSTATLSLITLAMTFSPAGPHRVLGVVSARLAVIICLAMAVVWACRWPTRKQSKWYATITIACIFTVCISYADPLFGLIGCMSFGVIGGYIAFAHTARLLMVNLSAAAVTTLTLAIRLFASSGDLIGAVCAFLIVGVAVVSVPFASHALLHSLGVDVMDSDIDPLCGLLNRRAFHRFARELVAAKTGNGRREVAITMVDLDDFKSLNDTRGHAVGDQALIAVGDVLRRMTSEQALVARVGGEEFLVAQAVAGSHATTVADRVRTAIASTSFGITASVGVASITLEADCRTGGEVIDRLIDMADAAMYEAKRAGGNGMRHRVATESYGG